MAPKTARNRQQLELAAAQGDLGAEVEVLVSLGATLLENLDEGAALADPDGNEFRLMPTRSS